jgi:hypothetical protein
MKEGNIYYFFNEFLIIFLMMFVLSGSLLPVFDGGLAAGSGRSPCWPCGDR